MTVHAAETCFLPRSFCQEWQPDNESMHVPHDPGQHNVVIQCHTRQHNRTTTRRPSRRHRQKIDRAMLKKATAAVTALLPLSAVRLSPSPAVQELTVLHYPALASCCVHVHQRAAQPAQTPQIPGGLGANVTKTCVKLDASPALEAKITCAPPSLHRPGSGPRCARGARQQAAWPSA
jgi:hypothetical protein